MRNGTDVINKPIITFLDGRQVGRVHDLIFDHKRNLILGFLADEGGWFSSAKVLPLERVKTIGADAVVVETEDAIMLADEHIEMREILETSMVVRGTKLMTESGKLVGTLSDLLFDEVSGRVESYEVSGGLFADMYNGRSLVPANASLRLGKDVAFVADETIDLLENQVGGLRGAAGAASESAKTAVENASEAAKGVGDSVKQSVSNVDVNAAKDKGEQLKEGAASLWESVKTKAGEYKDVATHETEEFRIRRALGRPASRVILSKSDIVILNVGDIITHEAVQKARAAGELEVLLTSVYDKGPNLSTDEMKSKNV